MIIRLDYGTTGLLVEFPNDGTTVIEPTHPPAAADPFAALVEAIRFPIGKSPLRELLQPGQTVGISVCDITRAQPRQIMLEALFSEVPNVRMGDVTIFIATGTHRRNTPEEIENMLGRHIARNCRVICHDARDEASQTYTGDTRTGIPVFLNRQWMETDFKITTGFVEPHFFAGFSGGPKMIAPGLAGLRTIMRLHDAARIGHPNATWGCIEGNPVQDDIREIARNNPVDFALDVTLNREQQITRAFAGELFQEHTAACSSVREHAMRPVDRPFDVVVTTNSGYPLDQNLYQAVKGMSAAAKIVRSGGVIICASECRDGLPNHGAYGALLGLRASPTELLEMLTAPGFSRPDQWQVQIQAQIQMKARVLVKSDGLTHEQLQAAHFEGIDDVGQAARTAVHLAGPEATLCVLPQGPQTIPYIR